MGPTTNRLATNTAKHPSSGEAQQMETHRHSNTASIPSRKNSRTPVTRGNPSGETELSCFLFPFGVQLRSHPALTSRGRFSCLFPIWFIHEFGFEWVSGGTFPRRHLGTRLRDDCTLRDAFYHRIEGWTLLRLLRASNLFPRPPRSAIKQSMQKKKKDIIKLLSCLIKIRIRVSY